MKPEPRPEVAIGQRVAIQHLSGWEGRTGFVRARKDSGGDVLVELDYEPKTDGAQRQTWRLWVDPAAVAAPPEAPAKKKK